MKEQLIKFETAKLAKEKGCNLKGVIIEDGGISLCTQALLQKWLREVHNIQVYSQSHTIRGSKNGKRFGDYIYVINPLHGEAVLMADARDGKYQSYEEALEKGLQEALKLIK